MLRLIIDFTRSLLAMPKRWVVWVGLMAAANLVGPFFWLGASEARATLLAFALAATLQMIVFRRLGFVRLMGAGHSPWLILVPWLAVRLASGGLHSAFDYWVLSVIVLNGLSLVIDATDVVRWLRGERSPTVALSPAQPATMRSG
jgi:hypothetical protein